MSRSAAFAFILRGFICLTVQTLVIREFLVGFFGNELSIGIILSNWIILEASGSLFYGRFCRKIKNPSSAYALLQALTSIYLPFSILLIRNIKNLPGFLYGEGLGLSAIFLSSLAILFPLSFLDGAQFPLACRISSDIKKLKKQAAGTVYIQEAIGFIIAGPVSVYLFITRLDSFSVAFILGLLNAASAYALLKASKENSRSKKYLSVIVAALFFAFAVSLFGASQKLHRFSLKMQWRGQKILSYKNSYYGNIALTEKDGQLVFYNDGIPVITTPSPKTSSIEDLAHFTMLCHPAPKNVLLLCGGAGGLIKEVLKYPVTKATYAELDPLLIKTLKDSGSSLVLEELNDSRVDIRLIDARRLVKSLPQKYEVIILNLPGPSNLQLNRFFTREFFLEIKSALSEKGIFAFFLPGSLSYLDPSLRKLNSSVLNAAEGILSVRVIPGESNLYLLAKDRIEPEAQILARRLKEYGISTRAVNGPYIKDRLSPDKLKWFDRSLKEYRRIRKNEDLLPIATFYSLAYWNNMFSPAFNNVFSAAEKIDLKALLMCLFSAGFALYLFPFFIKGFKRAPVGFAIATTGFTGISLELIFIYAYQALFGFVFSHLGLLITAFMCGMALGARVTLGKLNEIKNCLFYLSKIECALVIFPLLSGPLILLSGRISTSVINLSFAFFALSFISGYLTGMEFPAANKIAGDKEAAIIYASDLLGSWLAALVVSVVFFPIIGVMKTCLFLAGLKALSLSLLTFRRHGPG
ncbi:MAG: fused MFS/spermidine synthase [Candidatus Omnitrophica bacterium]|nr:fused MFS/spermidine synthase [Candidatus Omnitrophota bacterium]